MSPCTTAHQFYTRSTKIIGAFISKATMRPNPIQVWVSSVPWLGRFACDDDRWGSYVEARQRVADFVSTHAIANVVVIAGDMHGTAWDDGSADYSAAGAAIPGRRCHWHCRWLPLAVIP